MRSAWILSARWLIGCGLAACAVGRHQRLLPRGLIRAGRGAWEDVRDWLAVFAFTFKVIVGRLPRPTTLIFFGYALGDDLHGDVRARAREEWPRSVARGPVRLPSFAMRSWRYSCSFLVQA